MTGFNLKTHHFEKGKGDVHVLHDLISKKLKSHMSQGGPKVRVNPSFCSMKQLRVLPLPPGWDASQSQGCHQQYVVSTYFTPRWRDGERQSGVNFLV